MSNIIDISTDASIEQEAAAWVSKLDGSRLPAKEFAEFKKWVSCDHKNKEAFEKVASVWGQLDILGTLAEPAERSAQETTSSFEQILSPLQQWRPQLAIASLFVFLFLGFAYLPGTGNISDVPHVYATKVGQSESIMLTDGSSILLNTDSRVEVKYSEDKRQINLLRGEAHFDVAHDPARPFEVHAGTNIVRAVGTAFSVELKTDTVEVTVTEGTVELATLTPSSVSEDISEKPLALLNEGQSAEFSDFVQSLETIEHATLERKLAWHTGGLVFEGDKLADVVAEVSRYTNITIVISDPALRTLEIGGYFKTDAPEAMLAALEENFQIEVEWVSEELVYLSQSGQD